MAAELRLNATAQRVCALSCLQHQSSGFQGGTQRLCHLQRPLSRDRKGRVSRSTECAAGNGQHAEPQDDQQLHVGISNGNGSGAHHDRHDALPLSLYHAYVNLPCDGKTRSEQDEACDPNTRDCQTPMHIWETNCKKCSGTGTVASYRGGRGRGGRGARRLLYTCPTCHGVGCVRHTSTRILPDVNGGNGQYTAGRPPCEISWEDDGSKKKSLFERFKEKLGS